MTNIIMDEIYDKHMSNMSALFAWQIQMAFMLVLCQSLGTPTFTENN
jgi:hypothetical protein